MKVTFFAVAALAISAMVGVDAIEQVEKKSSLRTLKKKKSKKKVAPDQKPPYQPPPKQYPPYQPPPKQYYSPPKQSYPPPKQYPNYPPPKQYPNYPPPKQYPPPQQYRSSKTLADGIRGTLFEKAVIATGLLPYASHGGPVTIFAPTDDAFKSLGNEVLTCLLKPQFGAVLVQILKYHVVIGRAIKSSELRDGQRIRTLEGSDVTAKVNGNIMINSSKITSADNMYSNGIIQWIEPVLNNGFVPRLNLLDFIGPCIEEEKRKSHSF